MNDEIRIGESLWGQISRDEYTYRPLTSGRLQEALNELLENPSSSIQHYPLTEAESFNFELKTKTTREKIKNIKI